MAIILDNFSPHLTTKTDTRVGDTPTPTTSTRVRPVQRQLVNRIEAQVTGLRTSRWTAPTAPPKGQGRAIRRYIAWERNRNPHDRRLRGSRPGERCLARH